MTLAHINSHIFHKILVLQYVKNVGIHVYLSFNKYIWQIFRNGLEPVWDGHLEDR